MKDKDAYEQQPHQAKEDVVEFESEMPEKAKGAMAKAKGAFKDLMEKAKESVEDLKGHKK